MVTRFYFAILFLLPSFNIFILAGLAIPYTLISIVLLIMAKSIKKIASPVILALTLFYLFFFTWAVISKGPGSMYDIAFALLPLSFIYFYNSVEKIDGLYITHLVIAAGIINSLFCIAQIVMPNINLSNINPGYTMQEHTSAVQSLIALPFVGRLRGIYHENGPMVLYLIMQSFFLWSQRECLGCGKFLRISLTLNIIFVLITGSKSVIVGLLLIAVVIAIKFVGRLNQVAHVRLSRLVTLNWYKGVLKYILLATASIMIIVLFSSLAKFIVGIEQLESLQGVSGRLRFNEGQILLSTGQGLRPSSTGEALSLNAFLIYGYAYGTIVSAAIVSLYLMHIDTKNHAYILLVIVALFASGSLFIPLYAQAIILSRIKTQGERGCRRLQV